MAKTETTYSETGMQVKSLFGNQILYSLTTDDNGKETEKVFSNTFVYSYNSDYNQVTGKTVDSKTMEHSGIIEDETGTAAVDLTVDTSVTYDWFGRTESRNISVDTFVTRGEETSESLVVAEYSYYYADDDTTASTKITSHSSSFETNGTVTASQTDNYEYDAAGNITGIFRLIDGIKTYFCNYEYDEASQLVREDLREDEKTIVYCYDTGGNIVSKTIYEYTQGEIPAEAVPVATYTYEYNDSIWKDKLTAVTYNETDSNSEDFSTQIAYDNSGNITSYKGYTYTWNGRQLESSLAPNGEMTVYRYNANGLLSNFETFELNEETGEYESSQGLFSYIWDGDRLAARIIHHKELDAYYTSRILYDTSGEAIGIELSTNANEKLSGAVFLYQKNLQGDVIGIIESDGDLALRYTYDAYGNLDIHLTNELEATLSDAVKALMMFLFIPQFYRGYTFAMVSDQICYYLGSRYYLPELGRFLNADIHADTGTGINATNMFAYCNNNPVMMVDPTGEYTEVAQEQPLGIIEWLIAIAAALISYVQFAEHTKNKRPSTYDKHTKPRPGRQTEKKKQKPNWKPR